MLNIHSYNLLKKLKFNKPIKMSSLSNLEQNQLLDLSKNGFVSYSVQTVQNQYVYFVSITQKGLTARDDYAFKKNQKRHNIFTGCISILAFLVSVPAFVLSLIKLI